MVKDLGFCKAQLFNNYIVCIAEEGVTLSIKESQELIHKLLGHFNNRPFIYIIHRINSYAVDPEIYNLASQIENLLGFAVVATNHLAIKNAEIEKLFCKKPFEIFDNLDSAKQWAEDLLNE